MGRSRRVNATFDRAVMDDIVADAEALGITHAERVRQLVDRGLEGETRDAVMRARVAEILAKR